MNEARPTQNVHTLALVFTKFTSCIFNLLQIQITFTSIFRGQISIVKELRKTYCFITKLKILQSETNDDICKIKIESVRKRRLPKARSNSCSDGWMYYGADVIGYNAIRYIISFFGTYHSGLYPLSFKRRVLVHRFTRCLHQLCRYIGTYLLFLPLDCHLNLLQANSIHKLPVYLTPRDSCVYL